ncbi:amidohydrolase [Sphingobium sp. SCG-1]|uniref:amidohydrolase family protein n=1 Tax=Sphingobium sp. SCG-1 TaxID=2072936 RepID=UPI000CD6A418|nr:amidohydrolase family protein [Sphingobium sp. SCG-1]AUW57163.1 amidohydrolase [Sphingobium sp. SCG-1]
MEMKDMVLISVDDHVIEPPDAFLRHYPAHARAKAPHMETKDGKDFWVWQDRRYPTFGLNAVVGRPRSEYGMEPSQFEQLREGTHNLEKRIDDMNVNGMLGGLNFPTMPTSAGKIFIDEPDRAEGLMAVRAYNDWHLHEWCEPAKGRMIPMILLPLWSMQETLEEIKRMSKLGVHAITFPDNPSRIGLPSIHNEYWEPLWKACADYNIVINAHIGTGARAEHASDESPIDAWITTMPMSIANSAADWLFADFWNRYPNLKIALSEGGIGWIPYFLERADFTYEHHHEWTFTDLGKKRPSERFKQHFITCFIDDQFGVANLDYMNEEMVMWECDYPHSDTVWPNSPEYLWACVNQLDAKIIDKITHRNAMEHYSFDAYGLNGGRENCTVGALRERGKHVDVSPRQGLGGLNAGAERNVVDARRPITSGEIQQMFESA